MKIVAFFKVWADSSIAHIDLSHSEGELRNQRSTYVLKVKGVTDFFGHAEEGEQEDLLSPVSETCST
ncbi:MAG: hypothetical protein Q9210_003357 [Variospora velana]